MKMDRASFPLLKFVVKLSRQPLLPNQKTLVIRESQPNPFL